MKERKVVEQRWKEGIEGRKRGREEKRMGGRKGGEEWKELTYGPEPQHMRKDIEHRHWDQQIENSISDSSFNGL